MIFCFEHIQFLTEDQHTYLSNINKVMNRTTGDIIDENEDTPVLNCNNYDIDELREAKFNSSKSFSIFHMNIHSIQLHIEELKLLLQIIDYKFDILAITESKIEKGTTPTVDITLENYHSPIGTPTEATKEGVLLYISKDENFKPRDYLNI